MSLRPLTSALLGSPRRTAATLTIAAVGGGVLTLVHLPAAWLIGAMIAVGIAALCRMPAELPVGIRDAAAIIVGTSTGSGLTPDALVHVGLWVQSMALLLVAAATGMAASAFYLRRVHGWGAGTARYSAIPGALSTVMLHAVEQNADVPRIAIAQIIRQWVVIAVVALFLMTSGSSHGSNTLSPAEAATPLSIIAFGILLSAAGALALRRIWAPAGLVLGSMVVTALLHGTGMIGGRLPSPLVGVAFVAIGASIGCRFAGLSVRLLIANVIPSIGAALIAVAVSVVFALVGARLFGMPFATVWLAYAPGAVEVILSLALAVGADIAFVVVHHIIRLLSLNAASPLWSCR